MKWFKKCERDITIINIRELLKSTKDPELRELFREIDKKAELLLCDANFLAHRGRMTEARETFTKAEKLHDVIWQAWVCHLALIEAKKHTLPIGQ